MFLLFSTNLKINTPGDVAVWWVDSVFLVPGKPILGENEISETQFNLIQMSSAIVKDPKAAVAV